MRRFASCHEVLRKKIIDLGSSLVLTGRLNWAGDGYAASFEDWQNKMMQNGEFGDHLFLQMAAEVLNRNIAIVPIFAEQVFSLYSPHSSFIANLGVLFFYILRH